MSTYNSLCVFCGAQNAVDPIYLELGTRLGQAMAERKRKLVYGGGDCGIMGAVANAVMQANGHVTGVFPISLRNLEREHRGLTEIVMVGSMHERKKLMFDLSDAFIVLPGGFGTMDEMFEILTWRQLQLHQKPVIIVNYNHYWDPLISLMENIIHQRFARVETEGFYQVVEDVEHVFAALEL